jgi:Putative adhesin
MNKVAFVPAVFLAATIGAAAASVETKEIRQTIPLDPDGSLSIETYKGSIDVRTWDRAQAEVVARVEPDESDHDRKGQEEKVRDTEIRIEGSGRSVRIESDYDRVRRSGFGWLFGDKGTLPLVRYEVRMPATARLRIDDYKSETRIDGLRSDLDLETYKGRVEIDRMDGEVRLETYKGEVRIAFSRFDRSEFTTYKGDITIALPREAAFSLDADVGRRGSLESGFSVLTNAAGVGKSLKGSRGTGGPTLRVETYKGRFRIVER